MSIPQQVTLIPHGQQDVRILPVWEEFFKRQAICNVPAKYGNCGFSLVIELGTFEGGFISAIQEMIPGVPIWTWNIEDQWAMGPSKPPLLRIIGDVVEYRGMIADLIHRHKTLVMVDTGAGDKPRDFNEFAKYLKAGDAIGIHDYFDTQEDFDTPGTFPCWELGPEDIAQSTEGLTRVMKEEFRVGAWGVWVK